MSNPRENAVILLHQTLNPDYQTAAITDSEDGRAFIKMLTETVLRRYVALEKLLKQFVTKNIPHKYALIRTVLLCGATEILFMNSPDYAIINSYVEIAKKHCGKSISGFVNAVLRNIIRQKDTLPIKESTLFFPTSFRKLLQQDYGSAEIARMEQAVLSEPPLNITVKANPAQWAEKLGGKTVINNSISITSAGKITALDGYNEGAWWVQDTAASLAVHCFSSLHGKRVLDLCAAPGGKTAQLIANGAEVTALDCSSERLEILRQNLQRLNLTAHKIICADALEYLKDFKDEPYDAVLLDAPCSATGIFRRHPEIIHLKFADDIIRQSKLQQQILQHLSPALKPGGELVYCTCSIAKAEGEKQILQFTANNSAFRIEPLKSAEQPQIETPEGFFRTLPFHFAETGGCDAFFIAKLIKENPL